MSPSTSSHGTSNGFSERQPAVNDDMLELQEQTETVGRRKLNRRSFLLGGSGLAAAGGAALLVKRAGGNTNPGLVQDGKNRKDDNGNPITVKKVHLAVTDGWVSLPGGTAAGTATIKVDPYFPDGLAPDASAGYVDGLNAYVFGFRDLTKYQVNANGKVTGRRFRADAYDFDGTTELSDEVRSAEKLEVLNQKGHAQISAPMLWVTAGEVMQVKLTNLGLKLRPDLVDGHTMHWHGFRNALAYYDGVPETSVSVPIGRDFVYDFQPRDPGTYMYHCHFEDVEHITMGMTGSVWVTPADDTATSRSVYGQTAYDANVNKEANIHGDTKTTYDRVFAFMLTEFDVSVHWNDAHIQVSDFADFNPTFRLMNGRAFPDTLLPDSDRPNADGSMPVPTEARLQYNPIGSKIQGNVGERVLLRIANLGFETQTLTSPGLSMNVIGQDARFLGATDPAYAGALPKLADRRWTTDTITIGPGESRDIILDLTGVDAGTYPLYNRDMSKYPGDSSDPNGAWVGGQRTNIEVVASGLPKQDFEQPNQVF